MRVAVIIPPEPVVTLDEAYDHLRVDSNDEESLIEAMTAAATAHIDGPAGWLGRSIGAQTLEAHFDGSDARREFWLPYAPVRSISEIASRAADGSWITIDPLAYELMGDRAVLTGVSDWPFVTRLQGNFRIRYETGYEVLPAAIRAAILLMTGDLYRNRDTVAAGIVSAVPMSVTVEHLLAPFRIWR